MRFVSSLVFFFLHFSIVFQFFLVLCFKLIRFVWRVCIFIGSVSQEQCLRSLSWCKTNFFTSFIYCERQSFLLTICIDSSYIFFCPQMHNWNDDKMFYNWQKKLDFVQVTRLFKFLKLKLLEAVFVDKFFILTPESGFILEINFALSKKNLDFLIVKLFQMVWDNSYHSIRFA